MTAEELLKRYAAGERDFRGVNLNGANLSGVDPRFDVGAYAEPYNQGITSDLSGINLSGTDLSGTNFRGVNLSGADLSGANLSRSNLNGSNLTNTNLSEADLSDAAIECARLEKTNMRGANLLRADIRISDSFDADIKGAKNVDTVNFTGAIMQLVLEDGTVIDTTDNDW